jgi:REP element-mobilizing transposase RayT
MRSLKQLPLPLKSTHGGFRKGAGRKNRSRLQSHVRRPVLNPRHPLHVTLRMRDGLPSLRKKEVFHCLKEAVRHARGQGLSVHHFAILGNHIHLILESQGSSVSRSLQSLGISFAKRLNHLLKRQGPVFQERYHQHVLKTPSEVKRALAYVLTNESHHSGDEIPEIKPSAFNSAHAFTHWKQLLRRYRLFRPKPSDSWSHEILSPPKTWLLSSGWMRA